MLCKNPYMVNGMACPCTKCMPCRFNRRRMWTHRILLETMKHSDTCFLTLTYDDQHLPSGGSLVPRDIQLFIKRLRKAIHPIKLRYFFVGEYGDNSSRPHYHAALFGISPLFAKIVQETWNKGHVMLGDLNLHSAQYIAGYTVKKMTSKDDKRLNFNQHPEFARMSLKPGIGAVAIEDIANAFKNPYGAKLITDLGDVPIALQVGSKKMPLGRYLRRKLREKLQLYNINTGEIGKAPLHDEILKQYSQELQDMYISSEGYKNGLSKKEALIDANKQKVLNLETRTKIYQSRKTL
jgi:hypothetical protein